MTAAQHRAFEQHWPRWGLDSDSGVLDAEHAFGRSGPVTLEIGFGMGQSLLEMASADPARNFVGIEVHRPGVGSLMNALAEHQLNNVRVYCEDAVQVVEECIAPASLDTIQVFFPDPWHKKRHHKRRLIQAPFVAKLVHLLSPGGRLHLATDWEPYAEQMLEVLSAQPGLLNESATATFVQRPLHRPETKFERRGEKLGHGVWDLVFTRD